MPLRRQTSPELPCCLSPETDSSWFSPHTSTKPVKSNGSSSFGLRRRYSFESIEPKKGSSSSNSFPHRPTSKFLQPPARHSSRLLPMSRTLEPIPHSPTIPDEDNDNDEGNATFFQAPIHGHQNGYNVQDFSPQKLSQQPHKLVQQLPLSSNQQRGRKLGDFDEYDYNWDDNNGEGSVFDKIIHSPVESVSFLLDEFFYEPSVILQYFRSGSAWLAHRSQFYCKNTLINPREITSFIQSLTFTAVLKCLQLNCIRLQDLLRILVNGKKNYKESSSTELKNSVENLKPGGVQDGVTNYADVNNKEATQKKKVRERRRKSDLLMTPSSLPRFPSLSVVSAIAAALIILAVLIIFLIPFSQKTGSSGPLSLLAVQKLDHKSKNRYYGTQQESHYECTATANKNGLVAQRRKTCENAQTARSAKSSDDLEPEGEQEEQRNGILKQQPSPHTAQLNRQDQAVWLVLSVLFTVLSSSCCLTLFLVYIHRSYFYKRNHNIGGSSPSTEPFPSCIRVAGSDCGGLVQGYQNTPTCDPITRGQRIQRGALANCQDPRPSSEDQYYFCQQNHRQRKSFPFPPGTTTKESEPEKKANGDGTHVGKKGEEKCPLLKRSGSSTANNTSACYLCVGKGNDDVSTEEKVQIGKNEDDSHNFGESTSVVVGYCYCSKNNGDVVGTEDVYCCGEKVRELVLSQNFACNLHSFCPPCCYRYPDDNTAVDYDNGRKHANGYERDETEPLTHHYFFLDKFSHPDKVLFPIFWTIFILDFNFPNCSNLIHGTVLGIVIKLVNLYHHYSYFFRFWGDGPSRVPFIIGKGEEKVNELWREENCQSNRSQLGNFSYASSIGKEEGNEIFAKRQNKAPSSTAKTTPRRRVTWAAGCHDDIKPSSYYSQHSPHSLLFSFHKNNLLCGSSKITISLWLYFIVIRTLGFTLHQLISSWWSFLSFPTSFVFTHFLQILGLLLGQLCVERLSWSGRTHSQPHLYDCPCCGSFLGENKRDPSPDEHNHDYVDEKDNDVDKRRRVRKSPFSTFPSFAPVANGKGGSSSSSRVTNLQQYSPHLLQQKQTFTHSFLSEPAPKIVRTGVASRRQSNRVKDELHCLSTSLPYQKFENRGNINSSNHQHHYPCNWDTIDRRTTKNQSNFPCGYKAKSELESRNHHQNIYSHIVHNNNPAPSWSNQCCYESEGNVCTDNNLPASLLTTRQKRNRDSINLFTRPSNSKNRCWGESRAPQKRISFYLHEQTNDIGNAKEKFLDSDNPTKNSLLLRYERRQRRIIRPNDDTIGRPHPPTFTALTNGNHNDSVEETKRRKRIDKSIDQLFSESFDKPNLRERCNGGSYVIGNLHGKINGSIDSSSEDSESDCTQQGSLSKSSSCGSLVVSEELKATGVISETEFNDANNNDCNDNENPFDPTVKTVDEPNNNSSSPLSPVSTFSSPSRPSTNRDNELKGNDDKRECSLDETPPSPDPAKDEVEEGVTQDDRYQSHPASDCDRSTFVDSSESFPSPSPEYPNHMNCKSLSKKSTNSCSSSSKLKNSGIARVPTPPPPSVRSHSSIFASAGGGGRDRKTFISRKFIGATPPEPGPIVNSESVITSVNDYEHQDETDLPAPPPLKNDNGSEEVLIGGDFDRTRPRHKTTIVCSSRVIIPSSKYCNNEDRDEDLQESSSSTGQTLQPKPPSSLLPTSSQVNTQSSNSVSVSSKHLSRSGSQCCVNSSASSSPILNLQQSSTLLKQLQTQEQGSSSSSSIEKYLSSKMRRTSLPAALPAPRTTIHHGSSGVDTAVLYEAHGLVTEMLVDQSALPANIVAGLKALATLLKPQPTSSIHYPSPRPKPIPLTLSIDPDYTSDIDEIPYTGEKISTLPKRNSGQGKKGVPANILRRMSTSTWTTTTSATGMPTLEPQPHTRRRRSASFRSSALGPTYRRFSQHELSSSQRLEHGQRKTVCSLHPLSPSDLTHLSALAASTGFSPVGSNTIKSASASVSAAGSNRSSPASTPIPSPIPSPVPSRDPSPCNLRRTSGNGGSGRQREGSLMQQDLLGSSEHIGPSNNGSTDGSSIFFQHRSSPYQSTGNLLSLNNNNNSSSSSKVGVGGSNGSGTGSAFAGSSTIRPSSPNQCTSPTSCRQPHHHQDYSPPKVLFHSTNITNKPDSTPAFAVLGSGNETNGGLVEGDSLGLLSGKNPDEDNCSTTSTLGDGPGPPDNSSGNSNSLRLSPVTFTLQEPPDINEPYFSADDEGREDVIVTTSDGMRFDLQAIAVDPLLCRLHEWDYPIFDLERSCNTQILSHMCYKVFLETGLFETFRIPIKEFFTYFHALELGYRDKPYHNRMHAGDVLHGVYYLTSQAIPGFQMVPPDPETPSASGQRAWFNVEEASYGIMGANFSSLELMAMYVAAAMHDYDHPGRTNAFLVSTHAKEAILYNDRSVLENHHAAAAWSLLLSSDDCNFLKYLDKAEFKRFRYLVIEAILATDLKRHFEIVAEFNSKVNEEDSPGIDWTQEDDRLLVMEICIKLADINGPCKVHDIHVQWTYRIAEEFYEQGDEEAELGLPISPFMDRDHPQLARLQESFINHLVAPLCKACAEAGIIPGYWIEDQEDENDADNNGDDADEGVEQDVTTADDLSIATTSCQETDNENDESSYSDDNPTNFCSRVIGGGTHSSKRRIFCLQTKHLQDNHRHWMGVIKEESKKKEEGLTPVKTESVAISTEDPMETIEEENNTPHSLNRSFSFEKEDSKL